MGENDTTIKFKADIASLKKEFREASNIIRLANSEFKASSAQLDNWENDADGVSAKLTQLNTVLNAQKSQLRVLKEQYEKTVAQQGEASSGAQALLIKMNNQKAAVGNTEKQIRKYNGRLSELKSSTDEAEKASADFDTEVKNLDDSLEETVEEAGSLSDGFTVMKGVLADLAATAIKNVVQGFKDIGAAVKDAYLEYDEGIDNVIKATGATGEAADNLKESYKEVSKSVVADYGSIGDTLGEVNTRFGFTGEALEECTTQFMKFADITGSDAKTAVQLVSRAMGDAGIEAEDYSSLLDSLALAAQASGISVDSLTEYLTKYGAPMRALGMEAKDSIAIFSGWEKAGVNTEIAFSGMKNAIANWAKNGKDARVEFKQTLEDIAACPDIASATTQAIEIFGKKAGPDLADAIHGGRFEYEEFLNLLESSTGTVEATYEETQSGVDKVKLAFQNAKTEVADIVAGFIDEHKPEIESFIKVGMDGLKRLMDLFPKIKDKLKVVIDVVKDVGSYLIKNFGPILKDFGKALLPLIQSALKTIKPLVEGIGDVLKPILKFVEPIFEIAIKGLGKIIELLPELGLKSILENLGFIKDEAGGVSEKYQKIAESANKMADDLKLIKEENAKIGEEVLAEYGHYKDLAGELDNLVDKSGKIKEHCEYRVKQIVEELNPVMGDTLKIVDGELQGYKDIAAEIDNIILKKEAETLIDKGRENYDSAVENRAIAMQERWDHEDEKSDLRKQLRELKKEDYLLDPRKGGFPEYYKKKNQLLTDIESVNNALKKDKENIMGLTNEIENYENLRNSATENNISAMKRYTIAYSSNLITCNNGTLSALKKQSEEQSAIYEKMLEDREKGDKSITDNMLTNAQSRSNIAKDEYLKAKQIADEQGKAAAESFAAGADSMLNTVKVSGGKITNSYAEGVTSESETAKNAVYEMLSEASNSNDEFTRNTAKQLGEMFSQGFADGIEEATFLAVAGAAQMASSAMAAVQHTIDSHSPSRKTAQFGRFFTDGFAIGIAEKAKEVINSARSMAQGALNEIRQGIDSSGLLTGGTSLKPSGTGGNALSGSVVNNYNFNQTNNSPKALSRIEIYRQSKNLLRLK